MPARVLGTVALLLMAGACDKREQPAGRAEGPPVGEEATLMPEPPVPPATEPAPVPDDEGLPRPGDVHELQGTRYLVAGAGRRAFEAIATGESLVVAFEGTPVITLVPEEGQKIRVDPQVPSVSIDGQEHAGLATNSVFKKQAKGKVFYLLELVR
jgi:hypothetical protein